MSALPRPLPCAVGVDADDVHLAERGGVLLGPVEAQHPAAALATSSPAGSNHGSPIRSARSRAYIAPCSGWWANDAALTRSSSALVPAVEAADRRPPRAARAGPTAAPAGRRITHSSRTRSKPCRAASRAAAGWSACDQACNASVVRRQRLVEQRPRHAAAAGRGRTASERSPPMTSAKPVVGHPPADVVGPVAQGQPGRLVDRRGPVGRLGVGGDVGDLTESVSVHAADRSRRAQASWESRPRRRGGVAVATGSVRPWAAARTGSRRCARCRSGSRAPGRAWRAAGGRARRRCGCRRSSRSPTPPAAAAGG